MMLTLQNALYTFVNKPNSHALPAWIRYSLLILLLVAIALVLGEQQTLAQGIAGDAQGAGLDLSVEVGAEPGEGGGIR